MLWNESHVIVDSVNIFGSHLPANLHFLPITLRGSRPATILVSRGLLSLFAERKENWKEKGKFYFSSSPLPGSQSSNSDAPASCFFGRPRERSLDSNPIPGRSLSSRARFRTVGRVERSLKVASPLRLSAARSRTSAIPRGVGLNLRHAEPNRQMEMVGHPTVEEQAERTEWLQAEK